MTHLEILRLLSSRPQVAALRSLVTNTRLFPHLTGKRLLGCDLRRMPSYFKPTRSKGMK